MKKSVVLLLISVAVFVSTNAQNNRANTKKSVAYKTHYQRIGSGSSTYHTFEIRGGTLWGWGRNPYGEVGDGTTITRSSPVQIGTDDKWVSISAGQYHSLGLKADGTLWAWGYNTYGQVGDGTNTQRNNPVQIGTDNKWVNISAGQFHSLGLKSDGTLWAWGRNSNAQLGDGTSTSRTSPVQIGTDTKWVSIAAGFVHSLGIKSDGTLWAWGDNANGQLGDGSFTTQLNPVQIGTDTKWTSIAVGYNYTLGLKADGTLWAWGRNGFGQLGDGTNTNQISPVQIGTDTKWVNVAGGSIHSLGLKSDGTLWAWGGNSYGQLGDGTTVDKNSPVQAGSDNKWVSIAIGDYQSFGLKSDATLWAWGNNGNGELGDGTTTNRISPAQISVTLKRWLSIDAGIVHTLGVQSDGTLWAWGRNTNGELGDGTTVDKNRPVQIGSDNKWVSVMAANSHSLGLKSDGTLWAWGQNFFGELGDGTNGAGTDKHTPVQVGSDTKWVSITAGTYFSLGIKSDGTLWSWGQNTYGQLGDGTTTNKNSPAQVGTDNKWVSIKSGLGHTIGLKSDGTAWGWGANFNGQVGDGTNGAGTDKYNPTQVGTDNTWTSIEAASFGFSIGLKSNGTLWAWGNNVYGQLGDGTTTDRNTPVQIGSDNKWICMAGGIHTIALKSDGTLWTWGRNNFGQLGDGTLTNRSNPGQRGSDNNWVSITAGGVYSIGFKSQRDKFCGTGYNLYGQLGDKTNTNKSSFVCVCILSTTTAGSQSICPGQSAIIHGISRSFAGIYPQLFNSANGCDSTSTITLTIKDSTSSTINTSACNNYTLNSQNYTASGVYTQTLSNAAGCDSVITLNLTISGSTINTAGNQAICPGQSAMIHGIAQTAPTVYSQTFTAVGGCDSISAITLTIKNSTSSTINTSACNNYTLNSQNYSASGVYTQTISNAVGCDSVITLNLTINGSTINTAGNQAICPGQSAMIHGIAQTAPTVYSQTFTAVGGCDSISAITLTIKNPTSSTINTSACNNYTLNSQNYSASGVYTQTISNAVGCDSVITLNLTISGSTINTNGSQAICPGQSAMIHGIAQTVPTVYSQTFTAVGGCDSISAITLTLKNATSSTINASACNNYNLNGQNYTASGVFTQTVSNAIGCDSIINLNLTINNNTNTSGVQAICSGQSATIHGVSQSNAGVYSETLTAVSGCDSVSTITLVVNSPTINNVTTSVCSGDSIYLGGAWQKISGTYSDTLTSALGGGCDSIIRTSLSISPIPTVDAGKDTTVLPSTSIQIIPNYQNVSSALWTPSSGLDDANSLNPFANPETTTTYVVIVTSADGCSASDTITIEVAFQELSFSEFLSPNNDGKNDRFMIKNIESYPENHITIFNRWGDLVYEASPYKNEWDGSANKGLLPLGNQLPEGSYFYILKPLKDKDFIKGYVILKR